MRLPYFIAILGLALLSSLGLSAQSVRVIFASGQASLQRPDEPALRAIIKGETVIIGTRIVTGPDGRVILTPMPGVKSIITPNTTVLLESASESKTSTTEVTHHAVLDLKEGAVVSDLHKPEGVSYDYSIRTARGLAGARGTTFTVGINRAGIQTVVVAHGSIFLNFTDGRRVTLAIGHLSITGAGGDTKSVGNIKELPPAEQKIAQKWTEITVSAITSALESGIELDPAALQNALDTAKSLGITLSPALQARVDRVLEQLTNPDNTQTGTDPKTTTDVITEQNKDNTTGFPSIDAFIASLTEKQQYAFYSLRTGYTDEALTEFLHDGRSAAGVVAILNLYTEFSDNSIDANSVLTDLAIVGNDNFTAVGADTDGLRALILAYHSIDNSNVLLADEGDYGSSPIPTLLVNTDTPPTKPNTITGSSNVFFPGTGGHSGMTIYNISFDTQGSATPANLYVGAIRKLNINNAGLDSDTFITHSGGGYGFVSIHASDVVSLNNTQFSSDVCAIVIEAATLNLSNIAFKSGTSVQLNSKYGSVNFGSSQFGKVNLISNVSYGATTLNAANFGDGVRGTDTDATGGNIHVGHLPTTETPR